ncbi:CRISPR-associated protein [Gemmata sp. SH-PL17]|uniref:type I-G CRISPR-associated protein Csb2 n=1 Tax=Gemmata sp. SH-PL17 TaxID=1630693 RepID=UPI00078B4DEF|nr:type I-U CRISPR-associated protein Csb2 [Gemmata sp. SH-PL17]AMV26279.1 CRISPR-associated protein [Gemmata sp. SH-PL17]
MPVSVALSFPGGRFHATPWGHHVNEALPEWPPSPWRFLRALVAVWKRKLSKRLNLSAVEPVLSELAKTRPGFYLPPATLGHTRHYMPLNSTDESKRTKVFDAFVSLAPDTEIVFHWAHATLTDDDKQTLRLLLSQLGYFGRAESWCAAQLLADFDTTRLNCAPESVLGKESVRVLAADPDTWNGWSFKDKKIVLPDPKWNLLAETADLHLERWSDPPGSKWVTYSRPADCFALRPTPRPVSPGDAKTGFIVARFVLDVAEGRRPLPLVTETLPLAEEVRRQVGREYARVVRSRNKGVEFAKDDLRFVSPILHGKDEHGNPANSHTCAFYLPTDEDRDGRIDHITLFAQGHFSRDDVSALDRLRSLSFGKEGEPDEEIEPSQRRTTHRLLLVGLDSAKPSHTGQFRPARVWESATPYIAYRHLKKSGAKRDRREFIPPEAIPEFMVHVLAEDWDQRTDLKFPKPEKIEFLLDPLTSLGWRYRSLQFKRGRNRRGDDGYSRPFGAFRLTFSEPVSGPISLGYACHFGMGSFRPGPTDASH